VLIRATPNKRILLPFVSNISADNGMGSGIRPAPTRAAVMPALVAGIHVFLWGEEKQDLDSRDEGRSRPSLMGYARP
jgi:hypothetical protein